MRKDRSIKMCFLRWETKLHSIRLLLNFVVIIVIENHVPELRAIPNEALNRLLANEIRQRINGNSL